MVLQNIVDHYLNKILKDYIENYSSDQFNLKFGIAELNNLRIKLSAINVLDLPVKLKHGFIGNLTIKVNFKNIYSTQLSLTIKDVYLVFEPNSSSKYNEELEIEKQRAYKNAQLERIEQTLQLMTNEGTQSLDNKDDSFVTKILLQIFNNVQIRIENVHIRLEDELSDVRTPFAFGLTFSNLVFVTPDMKEKQKFKLNNSSSGIFKIAVLSHFGLYFNCYYKNSYQNDFLSTSTDYKSINKQMKKLIAISDNDKPDNTDYVLEPINFNCSVFIHRKPWEDQFSIPTADIQMDLDRFALDRKQFETLLVVVDNINRMSVAVAYKKWRPELSVKGNEKLWWRFAITCILETDVKRKQKNWSWNHMRDHLHKRNRYKELYKKKLLLNDKSRENLENLIQKYEDDFDVLNLTIVRNQAKQDCKDALEKIERKKQRQIEEKQNTGWFGGWWSKKASDELDGEETTDGKKNKMNLIEEVKKEFNDEFEKEKLYAAINYDESQLDQTYPIGYAAQTLTFVIKSINMNITDKKQKVCISEFYLNEVKLNLSVLPASNGLDLKMSINSMKMYGLRSKEVPIIEPIVRKRSANMIEVDFVLNPIKTEVKHDFGVKIQAQGLKVIYDKETVDKMIEMMSVTKEINLDEIQTLAALKLDEFQQRSLISLEHAIENHKKLSLSVNIEPSFIMIPETGSIEKANHILLVSLGHFDISSKLVDYNPKELEQIFAHRPIKDRLEIARNSAYEKYLLSISKVQLILSDKNCWEDDIDSAHHQTKQISDLSTKRHLIYPISLNVTFERSIITDDPDLALMKLNAEIPDIQLIIEHQQILDLLKLLLSIVQVEELAEMQMEAGKIKTQENQVKLRVQENNERDLLKAIAAERKAKQQQILNQTKIQAEFVIQKLLIELKTKENTIIRGLMGQLSADFKMTNENMLIGLNLESIQFFCCRNYYSYINQIQTEVLQQLNEEAPNAIKELQSAYASTGNQEDKKKIKRDVQIAKKHQTDQKTEANVFIGTLNFIMLEDFELKQSAVVIFNMQMHATYRQVNETMNVNLQLINTQMAITELSSYLSKKSHVDLYILKPCELICLVKMENEYQWIDINIHEISLSISPNMVQTLMTMLSKLSSSPRIKGQDQQAVESITTVAEFAKKRPTDPNSWYMKLVNHRESTAELALEAFEEADTISPSSENDQKIVKQEVLFKIEAINFIIESGGVSSVPLVRFNSNLLTKFFNFDDLIVEMQMFMEYYNEKNFNWEPIFDIIDNQQWQFKARLNFLDNKQVKDQKRTIITLESDNRLEVTISNAALSIFKSLATSFSKAVNQPEILSKEDQKIVINNSTEMTLFIYLDTTKLKCSDTDKSAFDQKQFQTDQALVTLNPFSVLILLPLSKDAIDYNSILNYSFIVNGQEVNRSLRLLSNDKSINLIRSNMYPGTIWKYVTDCSSRDKQTRNIEFYSNVIVHNHLQIPVGIYKYDTDGQMPKKIGDVMPEEKLYLPISVVYDNENQYVYIRPTENYMLPLTALIWRFDDQERMKPNQKSYKTVQCEPIDKKKDREIYLRLAHRLENIRIENCNETDSSNFDALHHFELYPQFLIRNLLPVELTYRTDLVHTEGRRLKSGESNQIIYAKAKNSELHLDLLNYNNQLWKCAKANFKWPKEDWTDVLEFKSTSTDETLLIAANYMNSDENGFRLLTIFAPFWMINNTGLRLKYKLGGDLQILHEPNREQINLVCFRSKQLTQKKKMQLAIDKSKWSEEFPVDVVGNKGSIMVQMMDESFCFFTIDISLSEVLYTKIVKISPFYTIVSRISFDLDISEDKVDWNRLEGKTSQALFPKDNNGARIYLRIPGKGGESNGVTLKCTAQTVLEVSGVMVCCNVEVTNHTVLIEIVNYYSGASPALLVNCLDVIMDYGQVREDRRRRLPPNTIVNFNWDNPLGIRSLIWSTTVSNEMEVYLDKDATGQSVEGEISWFTFFDDNQRIFLVAKNKKLAKEIFTTGNMLDPDMKLEVKLNGIGVSMVDLNIMKELCYFSISSSDVIWEHKKNDSKIFKPFVGKEIELLETAYQKFELEKRAETAPEQENPNRFDKIGGMVVNLEQMKMHQPMPGQLRRTYFNGIYLKFSQSAKVINVHMKLNKIQIDNQLDDHIFATILCPIPPPKSILMDLIPKPFVELSTIIQFNNSRRRFKYFSFLIQEFAIQIDLDFLTALQSYLEIVSQATNTSYEELLQNSLDYAIKPEVSLEISSSSKHQYDEIHLSPLKMHLSFSLGTIDTLNLPGILDYLVKSAGVTLIEFKDAVLKINSFIRENTMLTDEEFINELTQHYKAAALSQFFMIIFGLDVIGNPVGLLIGVTRGVNDLFYEPVMGAVQGPEEFAEGLKLGIRSLFSSTVGGVAGAFSRITGTLGEGISTLMEQSERKARRERLNKHAGILQNSKNLAKGFFSGITGLVEKPVSGVKREGFEGLIKGVGHGVVGLVAQPATGIIDFTSGTLGQLQRSVNVSEEVKRIRPARAIHVDGILTSYNSYEANGREMLKNLANKTSFVQNDIYLTHCMVARDRFFMITNKHCLYIKNVCLFKSQEVNWHLENSNITKIESNDKVIYFHLKKPKKALGFFGEKFIFELVCDTEDIVTWINNKLRLFIKIEWEF